MTSWFLITLPNRSSFFLTVSGITTKSCSPVGFTMKKIESWQHDCAQVARTKFCFKFRIILSLSMPKTSDVSMTKTLSPETTGRLWSELDKASDTVLLNFSKLFEIFVLSLLCAVKQIECFFHLSSKILLILYRVDFAVFSISDQAELFQGLKIYDVMISHKMLILKKWHNKTTSNPWLKWSGSSFGSRILTELAVYFVFAAVRTFCKVSMSCLISNRSGFRSSGIILIIFFCILTFRIRLTASPFLTFDHWLSCPCYRFFKFDLFQFKTSLFWTWPSKNSLKDSSNSVRALKAL